jgi:hypothetical protein
VLTVYGVVVLTFMMVMYALEGRDRHSPLLPTTGSGPARAGAVSLNSPDPGTTAPSVVAKLLTLDYWTGA